MWIMCSSDLKNFASQYATLEWLVRFKFSKVYQYNGESVDVFYNRILKTAIQCEFPDVDDHIIDAIIFGTNCVKAQDKLLQTPKTLSLQQCLSVVQHYESLKLNIFNSTSGTTS